MTPLCSLLVWQGSPQRLDRSCCPAALAAGSHAPVQSLPASCPGFCSTWPAGELGEAGAGMCAGWPARLLRLLAASLPAYGSPGTHLSAAGSGGGQPGAGTCVGRGGGPTCKAGRGLAASSQPYPAFHYIVPSQLSGASPQGPASRPLHAWTSGSCAEPPPRAVGLQVCPGGRQLSVGPKPDLGAGATDQG